MVHVAVGTQVVLGESSEEPSGVGVVERQPDAGDERYLIRLVDGTLVPVSRVAFRIRKESYIEDLAAGIRPADPERLFEHVILRCVVGSRAYGLAGDDSDTDRRGVYLAPADVQWSLSGAPEQIERRETDECYWELQKFLNLALKANPNILECLYTPLVESRAELGAELLGMRGAFLSKFAYRTYNGYVISQFKRLEQDLRSRGELRWKHAMHLIRLLLCGIGLLRDGRLDVSVGEFRDRLLAIKRGEWEWRQVEEWRLALHAQFEREHDRTRLPDGPDVQAANLFLLRARRRAAGLA